MSASLRKRPKCCGATKRRYVPCVDGSGLARRIFTSQAWSVQPLGEDITVASEPGKGSVFTVRLPGGAPS